MSKQKKTIGAVLGTIIALSALGGGIYYTWLTTPPELPRTVDEGLALMDSPRFRRLPDYRQAEYRAHVQSLVQELPPADRQAIWQDNGNPDRQRQLRALGQGSRGDQAFAFARATPAEREQMIREANEQMARWRRQAATQPARGPGGGDWQNRARDRIKNRFQEGNPQENGLIGEYYRTLREGGQRRS